MYQYSLEYKTCHSCELLIILFGQNEWKLIFVFVGTAVAAASRPPPTTMLTDYFELNRRDPDARNLLYPDICHCYRWIAGESKKWIRRKQRLSRDQLAADELNYLSDTVGRIPIITLNAHQAELYFLRLLLYHKAGATSFENLRMIDGELQPTFQAACQKIGLLDDDREINWVSDFQPKYI